MTDERIKEELKPCPFCGSPALMSGDDDSGWCVTCQEPHCNCNARIPYCDTKEDAIEQWNTRAGERLSKIEALKEARKDFRIMSNDLACQCIDSMIAELKEGL